MTESRHKPMSSTQSAGRVYLVGAGPGDPRLITVRGAECMAMADVVFYDGLVNPLLLRLTKGRCERTARSRDGQQPVVPQDDVNQRLIDAAKSGQTVVRLKGGDPYIFGRGSEEAAALENARISYEVVPGITAAQAGAEYCGFSFTHRAFSSAVAFVTAHEDPLRGESRIDFESLARFPGTVVFYMGLGKIQQVCRQMMAAGRDAQTPSAVICRASLPSQRIVTAPLESLADAAVAAGLKAPSLIVVGECVSLREAPSWFERLPLFGRTVGMTRSTHQADAVNQEIIRRGGEPVPMPLSEVVSVTAPEHLAAIERTVGQLQQFDWILFTSANAVTRFFTLLQQRGIDARSLGNSRIGVVGAATAAALERYHLFADVVPGDFSAESLAESIRDKVAGKRCLWVRGTRARDVLPLTLPQFGADLQQLIVYDNQDATLLSNDVISRIQNGTLDWIGLSSPSMAGQLHRILLAADINPATMRTQIATISPLTTSAATDAGFQVAAEAAVHSWNGLLDAIGAVDLRED